LILGHTHVGLQACFKTPWKKLCNHGCNKRRSPPPCCSTIHRDNGKRADVREVHTIELHACCASATSPSNWVQPHVGSHQKAAHFLTAPTINSPNTRFPLIHFLAVKPLPVRNCSHRDRSAPPSGLGFVTFPSPSPVATLSCRPLTSAGGGSVLVVCTPLHWTVHAPTPSPRGPFQPSLTPSHRSALHSGCLLAPPRHLLPVPIFTALFD
jgi:hypothetical protein